MDKHLYKLMNWPRIEAVCYSEEDHPEELLGVHAVTGGSLVQCFFPEAKEVEFSDEGKGTLTPLEEVDEAGFFAGLLP